MTLSSLETRCRPRRSSNGFFKLLLMVLLFGSCLNAVVFGQIDLHTRYNSTIGRTHLRGIRRIPVNLYTTKSTSVEDDSVAASSELQMRAVALPQYQQKQELTTQQSIEYLSTLASSPISAAPQASMSSVAIQQQFESLLERMTPEERQELHSSSVAPLHHPSSIQQQQYLHSKQMLLHQLAQTQTSRQSAPKASITPHYQYQASGMTGQVRQRLRGGQERQDRLKARWRKIGPLIDSSNSRYQRMRLIQQKAWTHSPTVTSAPMQLSTTESSVRSSLTSTTARHSAIPLPENIRPPSHPKQQVTAAQMAYRATQPTLESDIVSALQTNNIRRQSLRTGNAFASLLPPTVDSFPNKIQKPSRLFGERTQQFAATSRIVFPGRRITGPILTPLSEDSTSAVYSQHVRPKNQLPTAIEDNEPQIVEDFSPVKLPTPELPPTEDYHHRQDLHAEKRFRLVSNRLINRPRLKIRIHEEPRAQGKATLNSQRFGPITLPDLTPLANDHRHQLAGESSSNIPVFSSVDMLTPQLPIRQSPSQGHPRHIPKLTSWGNEDLETVYGVHASLSKQTEINGGPSENLDHGGNTQVSKPPSEETGESGASFGGSIGTPPLGFSEAFGLNGASVPLEELMTTGKETVAATTEESFFTTRQPKSTTATPNEMPVVISENSGLRPAHSFKGFQGEFGNNKGSSIFNFDPNTIESSTDAGFDNRESLTEDLKNIKDKKSRSKGKRPPSLTKPQYKEEDFFTGESALTPNHQGPTGDGYNPPVFPGQNVPPPVPSISRGGEAAGIPSPYQPPMMEVTENTPTTLKPSALLNILNKADEGFNQMLNNFEQGAPLESAMIDILEVALGSQKLDSQAKILSHLDRTVGLENLQRLQRWANTGGALDELKEQLVKIAKNYKPPPETNAITIPPEFEYLFKTNG